MPINPLITNNFIDSCAFDPKCAPEDRASDEIFKLFKEGKILIQIAHSTQKEIEHPNTPGWVKREAQNLIYTIDVQLTTDEVNKLREIETILTGNGKIENIRQDAKHIFEAQKYGSYFVTADKRILDRAHALHLACTVNILTPCKFLEIVKEFLKKQGGNQIESYSLTNLSDAPKPQKDRNIEIFPYKDYLIEPAPYQLVESGEWTINIYIRHDTDDQVSIKNFSAENTFKTKPKAIKHCIDFGIQIIDGKFPDFSVSDL